jgi:hypothetical protein
MAQARLSKVIWIAAMIAFVTFALALIGQMPSSAQSAAKRGDGYRTYPSCFPDGRPDSSCSEGSGYSAVFISNRRNHVHYRFCWRRPDGKHRCNRKGPVTRGHESSVKLYSKSGMHGAGTWQLKWKHGGRLIDRDRLHVSLEGE